MMTNLSFPRPSKTQSHDIYDDIYHTHRKGKRETESAYWYSLPMYTGDRLNLKC